MVERFTEAARGAPASLSDEDVLVVELLSRNVARAEIARRLGCSPATVERRIMRLRAHFGVSTTIEVVVRAVRAGLV